MPKELLPYSTFLVAFILINVVVYFIIQVKAKEKVFKELFLYWVSVFGVLASEGIVTEGKLGLSLIFLANFIPISIMSSFILRTYNRRFKFKFYLMAIPIAIVLSILLNFLNAPFPMVSAPIVLINICPFLESLYISLILHKKEGGLIEKIVGIFLSLYGIFCCINYGINRFNPTFMQYVFGFGSAFVGYLIYSILLPLYCIQQINRKRTDLLETLVEERTKELHESKQEKEKLLRVLVHDISNPLQGALYRMTQLKEKLEEDSTEHNLTVKSLKSLNSMKDVITHVREYESVLCGANAMSLGKVYLQECLDEIEQLFCDRFKDKNIRLKIHNKLPIDAQIRVDRTSFIHSVASNLVSNALKFSQPNSEVLIVCYKENSQIVIEFIDHGIGMSDQMLKEVFDVGLLTSRNGTLGESGTGFGLPIVKAYVRMFGGRIEVKSSHDKGNSGTTFALYLPSNATDHHQEQTYLQ
ncbi:MAG: sensor histidine kinase [Bacteriovorax sp.]